MLRLMRNALLAVCAACSISARAQAPAEVLGLEAGEHAVGFRLIEDEDASRMVTGGFSATPHARPLRVYLWYPANEASRPLTFGRYAALATDDVWPAEIAGPLRERLQYSRRPLARSLSPEAYRALQQRPMRASENAEPANGPFPLIALGQGSSYESPITFAAFAEYLAGHGFVVVTTPLTGTNSPLIKYDTMDLDNQVRDLELAIAHAREQPFVSDDMLGVLGFDMGGMAGVLLAMRNPDVDAFASLDAGIVFEHESGLPRISPGYDPAALRIPWLHATPPRTFQRQGESSESLFEAAVHAERYLLVTGGMGHVDFTSYALVEGRRDIPSYWPEPGALAGVEGHIALARYVLQFFKAYLSHDAASRAELSTAPEITRARMTLDRRPAASRSISRDEFVAQVVAGRAEEAVAEFRAAAAADPDDPLLDQMGLERLAIHLLFTWDLADETLPVLELLKERYPQSMPSRYLVGEAHVLRDDYPAAIAAYERILEEFPDDTRAKVRLEQLRAR